jgi:lipid-A-disaccharide synthase-like uncharacterized protein
MNEPLLVAFGITITTWKLVGYLGVALFAGRWFVQMFYSRRHGRPVVPTVFWLMSISGSLLLLSYFTFGKNDSVGILSNLFPAGVAGYNLVLDLLSQAEQARGTQRGGAWRHGLNAIHRGDGVAGWLFPAKDSRGRQHCGGSNGRTSAGVRLRHLPTGNGPSWMCMIRTRCRRRTR